MAGVRSLDLLWCPDRGNGVRVFGGLAHRPMERSAAMSRHLGYMLLLVGAAIMLTGFFLALKELSGMYGDTLSDPMGNKAGSVEPKTVSDAMLRYVIIGAAGIPVFLVGSLMLRQSLFQRLRGQGRQAGQ